MSKESRVTTLKERALRFVEQGDFESAELTITKALCISRYDASVHNYLGVIVDRRGYREEALENFQEALRLSPCYAEAHHNTAAVLGWLDRWNEAIEHYRMARQLDPDFFQGRINLATALLLNGRFAEGWEAYETRHEKEEVDLLCPKPQWNGEPLNGRTILLHAEQGHGDTIQCIRYAPLVKAAGAGKVLFLCQPILAQALAGCPGIDFTYTPEVEDPPHDCWVSLMSLPRIFKTDLSSIPPLHVLPPDHLVRWWHKRLAVSGGFKVGIAWQGNPSHGNDALRSVPLSTFSLLASIPGVVLYSLQKGYGVEQILANRSADFDIIGLHPYLDDFQETAAAIVNLDLVISVDTSVLHLAGAVHAPCWGLIYHPPDWRWLLNRNNSPWYPTMKLFRRGRNEKWEDVMGRVAATLQEVMTKG